MNGEQNNEVDCVDNKDGGTLTENSLKEEHKNRVNVSNTYLHAKHEFDILSKSVPDAIILEFEPEILVLCEKFGNSGKSGGSAPYTAGAITSAIKTLLMQGTIAPLTGEDDEWNDISVMNDGELLYQNKRESSVFKNGKTGRCYSVAAIVFNGDIGGCFTGNGSVVDKDGKIVMSTQYIRSFPFTPKRFEVDVIDHRWADKDEKIPDEQGDWWTHTIKDDIQLKEVFEYYDRYDSDDV